MGVHQIKPWIDETVPAPMMGRRWSPLLAIGLCALTAIAIQSLWIPLDADVSWLITVCERILSGARLYVDIIEVNPPASVWLYLPLVWVAHIIGVKPESVVAGGFVTAGIGSSLYTVKLTARLNGAPPPMFAALAAGFVTLVFPMAIFAQREHAALILALPSLAALALIAEGKSLRPRISIASGLAAGLVIAIKPHFALVFMLPAAWAARRRGSLKPLLPGIAAAATVLALYGAAFLLWARAYVDWLPVFSHTYLRYHDTFRNIVINPLLFPALALLLASLLQPRQWPAIAVTTALGSAGFASAAVAQAKGYPNHFYPGSALALFAALIILGMNSFCRRGAMVGGAMVLVCAWQISLWAIRPDGNVAAAIAEIAPPHPEIIALSRELSTGHPVTRNVNGTWAGSRAGLYVAGLAHDQGLRDPIAMEGFRQDIHGFAEDVANNAPDVILVEREDKSWLMREPAIADVMQGYSPRKRVGDVEVWARKPNRR